MSEPACFINPDSQAPTCSMQAQTIPQSATCPQPLYSRGLIWAFVPLKEGRLCFDRLLNKCFQLDTASTSQRSRLAVPNIRGRLVMAALS